MNYEFSLNKMALFSMIAGSIVIGILMFSAGLLVGSQWLAPSAAAAEAVAKNEQPDVPAEPVLHEPGAAAPKAPKAVKPEATAPTTVAAPTARISALPPAGVTAPPSAGAIAAQAQATNVADTGGIQIIQEAAADQATDGAQVAEYVTVQVGVFTDQNEANRLLKDVERKGYSPSFFTGRDAEARQWYAVRIGSYSDRQQAANTAANFTRQEKMKAVVRPAGSL